MRFDYKNYEKAFPREDQKPVKATQPEEDSSVIEGSSEDQEDKKPDSAIDPEVCGLSNGIE